MPSFSSTVKWMLLAVGALIGLAVLAVLAVEIMVDWRKQAGWTPLHIAAQDEDDPAVIASLAAAGGDPNARNDDGWTPLHIAAQFNGNPAIVESLAAAGGDPNMLLPESGSTPLHIAAQHTGNPAIVASLAAAGGDPNAREDDGWTPFHIAAQFNENPAVVASLAAAGGDPNTLLPESGSTPLHIAAQHTGNPAIVASLAAAGGDPNARKDDGWTPLHIAAQFDDKPAIIASLAAAGGDPNAPLPEGGSTPLHIAAQHTGNPAVIASLAAAGGDSNARKDDGWTPLHIAAQFNENPAIVESLAAAGGDPNAKDDFGETPLHDAAQFNENPAIVASLAAAGGDPNAKGDDGWTPLHIAAVLFDGNPDVVASLAAAGGDPNARKDDGRTPLHFAAVLFDGNPDVVASLAAAGGDPNAKDDDGWTPLHIAALFDGDPDVVASLAAAGGDPNAKDDDGSTPLHVAAQHTGKPAIVESLAAVGGNPNARDDYGWTPLHGAARFNENPAISIALLEAGSDPFFVTRADNKSTLILAAHNNENPDVVEIFLKTYLRNEAGEHETARPFPQYPGLREARCWFDDDSQPTMDCFYMFVNEDPDDSASPIIGFPVVKFRTGDGSSPNNPILHLGGGGPGGAVFLDGFWDTYENLATRSNRDIYVMDPRGVGMAHPRLHCLEILDKFREVFEKTMTQMDEFDVILPSYRDCRQRLYDRGRNLSQYNSRVVARDVESLRQALDVNQWALYGYSYGSRYAQTIARDYPDSVEAMILGGATFPNLHTVDFSAEFYGSAFDKAFSYCECLGTCSAVALKDRFWNLVDMLDRDPLVIDASAPGNIQEMLNLYGIERYVLTGSRLIDMLFMALYDASFFAGLPGLIDDLESKSSGYLKQALDTYLDWYFNPTFADAVFYTHFCAEQLPFVDYDLAMDSARRHGGYLGNYVANLLNFEESHCRIWSVAAADAIEGEPVATSIPTLFLQGALDPVTQIDYLRGQLQYFDRHAALVFDDSSHWGSVESPCAMAAAGHFIDRKQLPEEICAGPQDPPVSVMKCRQGRPETRYGGRALCHR